MSFNLFEIIEHSVRNHPDRTAILASDGREISYLQLEEIVDLFALRAAHAGVSKGHNVTLQLHLRTYHLCMIFALSKLGAVRVPAVDSDTLAASGLRIDHVVIDPTQTSTVPNVIRMDRSWLDRPASAVKPAPMAGFGTKRDVALIMSSSGTTGRPKLLGFDLDLINQVVEDQSDQMGTLPGRTLLLVPPTMAYGLDMALLVLRSGGQIIWPRQDLRGALSLLEQGHVDEIIGAPAAFALLVKHLQSASTKLRSVKRVHMTGSVASKALIEAMREYICRDIIIAYGSSELGPGAFSHADEAAAISGAVGKIVPWMEVRITDDRGNELQRGETGLLQFRIKPGRRIAPYIGEGEGTGSSADDWFISGDMGTLTENDMLCIQGRATDLINVGGNKIAPASVEELVIRFLGITEMVCAFGLPGPHGYDEIIVAIHSRNTRRIPALKLYIEEWQEYIGHVNIMPIISFPINDFGKIDRNKLRAIISTERRILM